MDKNCKLARKSITFVDAIFKAIIISLKKLWIVLPDPNWSIERDLICIK
jgi:hypothetical protein